jgi:Tol biopolymer transport system component
MRWPSDGFRGIGRRGGLALALSGLSLGLLAGSASVGQAAFPGRDGRIAFVWNADTSVTPQSCQDIFSIKPDGADLQRLTMGCPWQYSDPSYSANGKLIAFVRVRELAYPLRYRDAGIYVMNADGSNIRRITSSTSDEEPAISPNARWIVFDRYVGRTHRSQLFRASLDGSGVRQLTHGQGASEATFSPDGRELAFVSGRSAIDTIRIDGSRARQLTRDAPALSYYTDPDFSPNGRRIVFLCGYGEGFGSVQQVCTMHGDGTQMRHLTPRSQGLFAVDPVFSPDGRAIAFVANGRCNPQRCNNPPAFVYAMRVNGTGLHVIFHLGHQQELGTLGLSWQPLP